jgi:metallo-beta-lactamase class B
MKKFWIILFCTLIQLPGNSQPDHQRIRISDDLELIKISENAFLHVSFSESEVYGRFSSNGLIFINNGDAFLFDTPATNSLTRVLTDYLTDSLKLKIVGFVPNHWHSDCMGGLAYLKSIGIESWASQKTIDIANKMDLPLPAHGFSDSLILEIGDKTIECYYPGPGHSTDNIVVWIQSEKILFAGCMIKDMKSTGLGNTTDSDLAKWPVTIEKVISRFGNAKIVIPGHGQHGDAGLLKHTLALFSGL